MVRVMMLWVRTKYLLIALLLASPVWGQGSSGKTTLIKTSLEPLPACTPAISGTQQPTIWDLTIQKYMYCSATNTWSQIGGAGGGAVLSFSVSGTTSPLFTTAVTN